MYLYVRFSKITGIESNVIAQESRKLNVYTTRANQHDFPKV